MSVDLDTSRGFQAIMEPDQVQQLTDLLKSMGKRGNFNSALWFPRVHENAERALSHMAIGLAEEAGEAAAQVKKAQRWEDPVGPLLPGGDRHAKLAEELSDVLIYLCNLIDLCNVDIGQAVMDKTASNHTRFIVGKQ